jgi:hypothetical protein
VAIATFVAAVFASGAAPTQAGGGSGTITGLYSTGYSSSGGLISTLGGLDGNYAVTFVPSGQDTTGAAEVDTISSAQAGNWPFDAGWTPSTAASQWILAQGSGFLDGPTDAGPFDPGGYYVYQTSFDVTGPVSGLEIQLFAAVDNDLTAIVLNPTLSGGNVVGAGPFGEALGDPTETSTTSLVSTILGFDSSPLVLDTGFADGTNILAFVVFNSGTDAPGNPSGLDVRIVGAPVAPEPGSMALLAAGIASVPALRVAARRRRA